MLILRFFLPFVQCLISSMFPRLLKKRAEPKDYSETFIQGTPSGPRQVSPEWRLGWLNSGDNVVLVLLNYTSAFDTVNHNLLLSRLKSALELQVLF